MLRQSERFGVNPSSRISSRRPSNSRTSCPGVTGSRNVWIPSCSSSRMYFFSNPSSSSEQIIPSETTPRNLARLILIPGRRAPTRATMTSCPASTFGAPHTIWTGSSCPISTVVTFNLSASGCFSFVNTRPTTMLFNASSRTSTPSTSIPLFVIKSAKSCPDV